MPQKKNEITFFDYFLIYPDMENQGLISKRALYVAQMYVMLMTGISWYIGIKPLFYFGLALILTGIITTFIFHLKNRKNADYFILAGMAVGILFSFAFIVRFGGIVHSGGLILVGPAIVVLSLVFQRKEWSFLLFGLYLITLLASPFIGSQYQDLEPLTANNNVLFFAGNIALISYLTMEVMISLFRKSDQASQYSKAMRNRANIINASKSSLYKSLTGPFKYPLTDIQTMVRLIHPEAGPTIRKKLGQIDADSQYLLNILRQLQNLTLLEAGKLEMNRIQSDFISFSKHIAKYYEKLAKSKSVSVVFKSNIDQFNVDFDPDKVQSLFSNLFSDAIFRSKQNDKIVFTVNRERENSFKDFVDIILSDNGSPLSQQKINLILHPDKHKWDSNPEVIDWRNLAYSYVSNLIAKMEGNVFIRSKPSGGNRIRIHLPVHNAANFIGKEEIRNKLEIIPFLQPVFEKDKSHKTPGKTETNIDIKDPALTHLAVKNDK